LKKLTTEEFIERAKKVHGDRYNYSKTVYGKDNKTEVCIICPIHGEFKQKPNVHLRGHGCHECGIIEYSSKHKYSIKKFVDKARKIHGDKYDYSKTDLEHRDEKGKVCIICPIHGEFWQTPVMHLQGEGCKKMLW
jgi:ferredoxin-like protein FixX